MTKQPLHILLIGCGKMGGAMVQGWLNNPHIGRIDIIKPSPPPPELQNQDKITYSADISHAANGPFDIAILAVKPQIMTAVCESLKNHISKDTPILSIAAGKTIAYFQNIFGSQQPIIRTMPNTPSAIGQGMTIFSTNEKISEQQKQNVYTLLEATGEVEELSEESLIDTITPISGCGPAYIFHLIEILEQAAIEMGIPAKLSQKLARQTVIGSAALAAASPESAAQLRKNVTSPNGVTAAALEIIMDGTIKETFTQALKAAKQRSIELSGE